MAAARHLFDKDNARAEARLEDFRDPSRRRGDGRTAASPSAPTASARLLEKATPSMAKALQPKTEAEVGKLQAKLNYAGFRTEAAPSVFLGLKIICLADRLLRRRRHDVLQQRLDDRSR